jgi:serine/threonine protein kinase
MQTFTAAAIGASDYALANANDINSSKTSNIGTAAYIAPEVMAGRSYDAKVSRACSTS